jgi:hypothetical protein
LLEVIPALRAGIFSSCIVIFILNYLPNRFLITLWVQIIAG